MKNYNMVDVDCNNDGVNLISEYLYGGDSGRMFSLFKVGQ